MKKLFLFLLIISSAVHAQKRHLRSNDVITVFDSRLGALKTFNLPVYQDTTTANISIGEDSCGTIIFTRSGDKIWKRLCSIKKWLEVGSGTETDPVFNGWLSANPFSSYLPLSGGTMSGGIYWPNTQGINVGTNDLNLGGAYGISLFCSVGYELNWQAGWLTKYNNSTNLIENILMGSNLQFPTFGHLADRNGNPSVEVNERILRDSYNNRRFKWENGAYINELKYPERDSTNGLFLSTDGAGVIDFSSEKDPIYSASSWYSTTNNSSNWNSAFGWGNHASAGYLNNTSGDARYPQLSGTYNNPNWINQLAWSKITSTPTTLSGYGITNGIATADTSAMLKRDTSSVFLLADATTSSTAAVSTNLKFQIVANQTYFVMIDGTASKASTTTGLKLAIGAPAGCTIKGYQQSGQGTLSTAMTNSLLNNINSLGTTFATGIGVEVPFRMVFTVTNGANAGVIELQFATVTSNTATIFAGTNMRWQRTKGL
jgi:hypothetical protein